MSAPHGTPLVVRAVRTGHDAEALRRLRNECREWMNDTVEIGEEEQLRWFAALRRGDWRIFLYYDGPDPAAYGLIRLDAGRWWLSYGVTETKRGRGVGRRVATHLCQVVASLDGVVWADMRVDNERSVRALKAAGFVDVDEVVVDGQRRMRWAVSSK